jgi:uridine phosphorylase
VKGVRALHEPPRCTAVTDLVDTGEGESAVSVLMTPIHCAVRAEDFEGNDGKGRFVLLPGSRDRARVIAERLHDRTTREHPRGHDWHMGVWLHEGRRVDVGVISTGMGCPSIDLIVTELIAVGAKVLLRVGTSGSLQRHVKTGDVVVATAAVRDEATSDNYLPREIPALAAWPLLLAAKAAADKRGARGQVHFGPVHTKDSLYARELGLGPRAKENAEYQRLLSQAGILASEMECAHLFVLAQLGPLAQGTSCALAGALLAVIGDHDQPFADTPLAGRAVEDAIDLAFAVFGELAAG